jgi:hypothetical protein
MTKLKLGPLADDKPVRLTVELPAAVHRDLVAYSEILSRTSGQPASEPAKLIPPMVERFMATDRAFVKARRNRIAEIASGSAERSVAQHG